MQESDEIHWKVFKCILKYVQGTISYGIHYETSCALDLIGFIDFDWDSDKKYCKSTFGCMLSLGSSPICWSSKKKSIIALSLIEDEYRGASNVIIQELWL
jgi:hypothetical protein